jgi:hypothetical protein
MMKDRLPGRADFANILGEQVGCSSNQAFRQGLKATGFSFTPPPAVNRFWMDRALWSGTWESYDPFPL